MNIIVEADKPQIAPTKLTVSACRNRSAVPDRAFRIAGPAAAHGHRFFVRDAPR
jgi:hypothetical protein